MTLFADGSNNPDLYSLVKPGAQGAQYSGIGHLRIIDEEFLPGPTNQRRELFSRIHRTDDKIVAAGLVWCSGVIGVQQLQCFLDQSRLSGDDAEPSAVVNIQVREVEGQRIKSAAIDNQQLVVITHQIGGRAGNSNTSGQQSHLQLPQAFLATAIGVGNQRRHEDASSDGRFQTCFQLGSIEPEDDDIHTLSGVLDGRDEGSDSISRLCQKLQATMLRRMLETAWSIMNSAQHAADPTL